MFPQDMSGVKRSPALPIAPKFEVRPFKRPIGFTERNSPIMYSLMSWGYAQLKGGPASASCSCTLNLKLHSYSDVTPGRVDL